MSSSWDISTYELTSRSYDVRCITLICTKMVVYLLSMNYKNLQQGLLTPLIGNEKHQVCFVFFNSFENNS